MNWLDISILIFMGLSLWTGFSRGFLNELLGSAAWVCAIIIVYMFADEAYVFVGQYIPLSLAEPMGKTKVHGLFSIVFLGVVLFVCQFALRFVSAPLRGIFSGKINSFLGLCVGGFKAFIFLSIIWYGLEKLNVFALLDILEQARHSSLPQDALSIGSSILDNLANQLMGNENIIPTDAPVMDAPAAEMPPMEPSTLPTS